MVVVVVGGFVGIVGGNDFQQVFEVCEMCGGVVVQVDEDLVVWQVGVVVGGQDDGCLCGQWVVGYYVWQEILFGKVLECLVQLL